jgi:hypothetical protein
VQLLLLLLLLQTLNVPPWLKAFGFSRSEPLPVGPAVVLLTVLPELLLQLALTTPLLLAAGHVEGNAARHCPAQSVPPQEETAA